MPTLETTAAVALKNIVVATDLTPASRTAVAYAAALARRHHATLQLLHVVPPQLAPGEKSAERERQVKLASRRMRLLAERESLRDVKHHGLLMEGEVPDALAEAVRRSAADLVVIGTHGRKGVHRFMLGSVAEEIFRTASAAVLTVGPNVKAPGREVRFRRILFPTDFSRESVHALPYVFGLAAAEHAAVTLLHLVDPEVPTNDGAELRRKCEKRLRELVPPGTGLATEPQALVVFGRAAAEIVATARSRAADLVVLGVRGGGAFTRAATHLPGPTAYEVMVKAPCPVLTLRGQGPAR